MSITKKPTDRIKVTPELHQETKERAVVAKKTLPKYQAYLLNLDKNLPKISKMLSKAIENTDCIETAAHIDEVREKLNKLIG